MVETTLISFSVLVCRLPAQAQLTGSWSRQNPRVSVGDLYSVCFVDSLTGWAVGNWAKILKTTDGGSTWSSQYSGKSTYYPITSVYFIDAQTGWAVGSWADDVGPIIKTTDGGVTWNGQAQGFTTSLTSVYFVDSQNGWTVGYDGIIYKTTNGGTTWIKVESGVTNDLTSLFFLDSQTGWVIGNEGTILKTTNGGESWTTQTSGTTTYNFGSVKFVDDQTGYIAINGSILKTVDGGEHWITVYNISYNFQSLFFINAQTGWAVGEGFFDGVICKTIDGGTTWTEHRVPKELISVHFVNSHTGWAVGKNSIIIKTTDGGNTWTNLSFVTLERLCTAFFLDSKTALAGGTKGTILRTTNAGEEWELISSPNTYVINDIYFADSKLGWACQGSGIILKTSDGGHSWVWRGTSTSREFHAIFFINATIGWAVGGGSVSRVIYKTTDGGNTWSAQSPPPGECLMDVYFITADTGWTVGMNGTILKTTDGGTTWSLKNTGVPAGVWLNGVLFEDTKVGYAVGDGTILKTTDGGDSWTEKIAAAGIVEKVLFVDDLHGWAVGTDEGVAKGISGNGYIDLYGGDSKVWQTTDGGETWSDDNLPEGWWLLNLFFTDLNSGWAVGDGGYVLKYTDSFPLPAPPTVLQARAISNTEIALSWIDNSSNENGFHVYRSNEVSGAYKFLVSVGTDVSSYADTGLTNGTTYWYRVCSYNAVGNSALTQDTFATAGVVNNRALNRPVVASSGRSNSDVSNPALAVDGSRGTRWSSDWYDNQWIYVDLGQRFDIDRVVLVWEVAYGRVYDIDVSDDALNWTQIYHTDSSDGGTDDITDLSGSGRYVRMHGLIRATQWGFSLWEFEVYGAPVATDIADRHLQRIPVMFSLGQNYPNPFNPSTTIEYALPKSCFVSLVIYNVLGEQIAILKNEHHLPGYYKVEWRAEGHSSGVYFCRIQTNSYINTKKLILLR